MVESKYISELIIKLLHSVNMNERDYVAHFNLSSDLVAFTGSKYLKTYSFISSSITNITGFDSKHFTGRNLALYSNYVHPADVKNFGYQFSGNVIKYDSSLQKLSFRLKNVRGKWVKFNSYIIANGENGRIVGLLTLDDFAYHSYIDTESGNVEYVSKNSNFYNTTEEDTSLDRVLVTARELQVLQLLGQGLVAKQIAQQLRICASTVITHKKNLIGKFGVKNTAELMHKATRISLI